MSGRRLQLILLVLITLTSTAIAQPPSPQPGYYPRPVQTFPAQALPADVPVRGNSPGGSVPSDLARPSVPISHPDQIEFQLKTLTEQFAATGLIEEARTTAAVASRVRELHFDRLQMAHRAFPAQHSESNQKQIVLRVQMAEFQLTPDSKKLMEELLGNPRLGEAPTTSNTLSRVYETEQIEKWLADFERAGILRTSSRMQANILNGRSTLLKFAPEGGSPQKNNESLESAAQDDENAHSAKFIGTTLDASAAIRENNFIALRLIAENRIESFEGGTTGRRIQTESEIRDGQTLVLGGLLSSGTLTEVTRVPVLGDVPLVGRLFSRRKISVIETELLIVITPEIVASPSVNRNTVQPAVHSRSGR